MDRFYIITNGSRDPGLKVTHTVEGFLEKNGMYFSSHVTDRQVNGRYTDERMIPADTDCVIVIGGDGTLIQAACDTADLNIPIVGINIGKLGFLTDIEKENILPSLESILAGRYNIEDRMMLCGVVVSADGKIKKESRSLNDIVIHRGGGLRVIDYEVYVNDRFLSSFRADGVIICTPTGSTGYSLSAGGPIIEPKSQMMVITPICPHTLNTRSIVISADDVVKVVTTDADTEVAFDGHLNVPLEYKDYVTIRRSSRVTRIVRINDDSFLTVLHNKFSEQ